MIGLRREVFFEAEPRRFEALFFVFVLPIRFMPVS
jgi:hypothetical protein